MIRVAALCATVLVACSAPSATTTTASIAGTTTTTTIVTPDVPSQLEGWATTTITIAPAGSGETMDLLVAVADEPGEREQGLMDVTDLAGLDGMLFVFDDEVSTGFWMKDTLIPLDIAFFAANGTFVSRLTMEPCVADPCPVYGANGPYRYAVEVAGGRFEALGDGAILAFSE